MKLLDAVGNSNISELILLCDDEEILSYTVTMASKMEELETLNLGRAHEGEEDYANVRSIKSLSSLMHPDASTTTYA
jgi:hypothetical protein